jgi:hypothetical protein
MEEMDLLAGAVAYKHCNAAPQTSEAKSNQEPGKMEMKRPLTIVTASVDRIDLLNSLLIYRDLCLSGTPSLYFGVSFVVYSLRVCVLCWIVIHGNIDTDRKFDT